MNRHLRVLASLLVVLLVGTGAALAQTGGGYDLSWDRIAGGGGTFSTGSGYSIGGTIGQEEAGALAGGGYSVVGGFWAAADASPTPTATPSPTLTVAPSLTLTATPTRTLTATASPTVTATPYPRPAVGVQVVPSSGTLQATITARDAGCAGGNNLLQSLQFTRLANATVDVATAPVSTVTTTPTTVSLPSHPPSIQLTVHRVTAGQAATVELTVTDGCGSWPTFVGGGANAF